MYVGFAPIGANFVFPVVIKDGDQVAGDPTVAPTFRTYSGSGLMSGSQGSAAKLNTGTITGATNASPIVITSVGHGLTTGTRVTITGVLGNTAANGTFTVTLINSSTFSLDGSTGNGTYSGSGAWHVTGVYSVTIPVTAGNGYVQGTTYSVLVTHSLSSVVYSNMYRFTVT